MLNESGIIVLRRQVWVYAGKREEEGRTNLRGRESVETY